MRAVDDQRLALRLRERGNFPKVGEKAVVIGRGEKERVRPLQRRAHRLRGGLPRDAADKLLRDGDKFRPRKLRAAQHADVRADGHREPPDAPHSEGAQHGVDAARAAVRQKKAPVRAENARNVRLRRRDDARRR